MDSLLLIVIAGALVIALATTVFAWRVLRRDRHRSHARVAHLRELASEPAPYLLEDAAPLERSLDVFRDVSSDVEPEPAFLRTSNVVAPPATLAPPASLAPPARPAPPAPSACPAPPALPAQLAPPAFRPVPAAFRTLDPGPHEPEIVVDRGPFISTPAQPRWGRFAAVFVLFMGVGAGTVYGLYGSGASIAWLSRMSASHTPLELVSLSHRRDSGGEFVITGLAQNPLAGRATPKLFAVVYLFDREGQYFATTRASLDVEAVPPGGLAPFTIRVANAQKIGRYRLGFHEHDGAVFAHVDRRGQALAGTTAAVVEEGR